MVNSKAVLKAKLLIKTNHHIHHSNLPMSRHNPAMVHHSHLTTVTGLLSTVDSNTVNKIHIQQIKVSNSTEATNHHLQQQEDIKTLGINIRAKRHHSSSLSKELTTKTRTQPTTMLPAAHRKVTEAY